MHCTNSSRKTTLTLLDTRKLRLHSTSLDNGVSIISSSRQHASSRLLLSLRASIFHGNIGEGIHDLRSAYLDLSFESKLNGGEILRQTTKKVYLFLHLLSTSRSATRIWRKRYGLGVCLNYWAIFDTAKGVIPFWLDERTCLILSFTKSASDFQHGLEVKQWCLFGSAGWADDMVDTTFFFLSLGYRRDLFTSTVHISGIFDGEHSRETQDAEILLLLGRVQCNCDIVGLALCFLLYLYSR